MLRRNPALSKFYTEPEKVLVLLISKNNPASQNINQIVNECKPTLTDAEINTICKSYVKDLEFPEDICKVYSPDIFMDHINSGKVDLTQSIIGIVS
jgi:hypothetical protein